MGEASWGFSVWAHNLGGDCRATIIGNEEYWGSQITKHGESPLQGASRSTQQSLMNKLRRLNGNEPAFVDWLVNHRKMSPADAAEVLRVMKVDPNPKPAPVVLDVPDVARPATAETRTLSFRHQEKAGKPALDAAEFRRQVDLQLSGINEILKTEGMPGLKQRLNGWTPEVSDLAHQLASRRGSAGEDMAWLHRPDPRISNDPSASLIHGVGDARVNSVIGGNWKRLVPEILAMPDNVNWVSGTVSVQPAR